MTVLERHALQHLFLQAAPEKPLGEPQRFGRLGPQRCDRGVQRLLKAALFGNMADETEVERLFGSERLSQQ